MIRKAVRPAWKNEAWPRLEGTLIRGTFEKRPMSHVFDIYRHTLLTHCLLWPKPQKFIFSVVMLISLWECEWGSGVLQQRKPPHSRSWRPWQECFGLSVKLQTPNMKLCRFSSSALQLVMFLASAIHKRTESSRKTKSIQIFLTLIAV